jgi:hypothetical protein
MTTVLHRDDANTAEILAGAISNQTVRGLDPDRTPGGYISSRDRTFILALLLQRPCRML